MKYSVTNVTLATYIECLFTHVATLIDQRFGFIVTGASVTDYAVITQLGLGFKDVVIFRNHSGDIVSIDFSAELMEYILQKCSGNTDYKKLANELTFHISGPDYIIKKIPDGATHEFIVSNL